MRWFLPVAIVFTLACGLGPTEQLGNADAPITVVPNAAMAGFRGASPSTTSTAVKGRYIVKLRDRSKARLGADGRLTAGEAGVDDALTRAGARKARATHRHAEDQGLYSVDADADEATFQGLMAQEGVEWVEPVQTYQLSGFTDPYYKYQWNLAGLNLDRVHQKVQGAGIIVAVVDSGVSTGTDGPGNVLAGYDFMDDDADASDTAAATQSPSGSHGTHVAGTIAQFTNNGIGVAGIAPQAKILPVRVGDYRGVTSEHIAEGIVWAVDHGANVINVSIGGASASRVVEEACRYAYDRGVVVVAATGNEGYDGKVSYPAAYPSVIAVGAHDAAQKETTYSNHGAQLALLAPGGDTRGDVNKDGQPDGILQGTVTGKGWGYAMFEGTSMASPHVAGAAALLMSAGLRGPDAIKAALVGGAKTVNGMKILDIEGALAYHGPVTKMVAGDGPSVVTPSPQPSVQHPRAGMRPGMGPGGMERPGNIRRPPPEALGGRRLPGNRNR